MKKPNRLIHEKSPYLLQHAYNPVDWYPWSEEAFDKAKKEDKPIFLSIGYSTCHWCHVMEKESFEDEEVASLLNKYFVPVKVDREERPDVDHLYMLVCQVMTGHGGWPLTVIMTPDKKPFFAGTYFPKHARYGQPGLIDILTKIADAWTHNRSQADQVSEKVLETIQGYVENVEHGDLDPHLFDQAFEEFSEQFDDRYGGFGGAPKFPRPHDLLFLLRYYKQHQEEEALHMVTETLEAMRRGGIFDHLGYGFARYSVDRKWLVPHFEKMLYDNALLALAYLEAFQVTQEEQYAQVAREIFTYVLRDMTSPEGGFYSAEDADSEGVEGKFYVWTPQEIKEVLGEEEGELFCHCYDVTEQGNFEHGTSILNQIEVELEEIAEHYQLSLEDLEKKLEQAREKLFHHREKRVHPHKDDKVLTSWNGLMIAALARGARVLNDMEYAEAAERAYRFIMKHLRREDGRLLARYRDGEAKYLAYLDDYAFLVWGLMELYEATFQTEFLEQAIELTNQMMDLFGDPDQGGFFFSGKDGEELILRSKELYDGALPSGNSVAAYNLIRLAKLTSDERLLKEADKQLKAFAKTVANAPTAYSFFLIAMQFAIGPTKEIVIAGDPTHVKTKEMIKEVQQTYLPEAVVALYPRRLGANTMKLWLPLVDGKEAALDDATVYICENYSCQAPISDLDELRKRLGKIE
ncbi:thioredoxin domain-containing protein [Thermoflavimicrobium dichotomicum]|uniref:Spermatogenesis-associated protein 20-like TRX domain-containing protein n=1 Tax=Thermoflavimicrobium dichotomicum TaxID=46223 RepID=A0A1I3LL93_9BACL|nr:thioredoxin domain-containing protein [Thermoflavimicrobium dichotomicum]SFI85569.1 hypothetical protein SAMN05421852_102240 [Thermoflavimicrobium dichotomicum]